MTAFEEAEKELDDARIKYFGLKNKVALLWAEELKNKHFKENAYYTISLGCARWTFMYTEKNVSWDENYMTIHTSYYNHFTMTTSIEGVCHNQKFTLQDLGEGRCSINPLILEEFEDITDDIQKAIKSLKEIW